MEKVLRKNKWAKEEIVRKKGARGETLSLGGKLKKDVRKERTRETE